MTFEQLRIFVAVAEREHLTRAAATLRLTPSAVSAAIRVLEGGYGVELFHRVGRRIELSEAGALFLPEAKSILARAETAEALLSDLGGLRRGTIGIAASQTIAGHFLPPVLVRFHEAHPGVALRLVTGNTASVVRAVIEGEADLGFVEGRIDAPQLAATTIAEDRLVVVVPPSHPFADGRPLAGGDLIAARWILREQGSGTRSSFEEGLESLGIEADALDVALELPSNEAVLAAVEAGIYATALSESVVASIIAAGRIIACSLSLPPRPFRLVRHKERHRTAAALAFERFATNVR